MKNIKPAILDIPSSTQGQTEPQNNRVFRIRSRKPTLRAAEQEKPIFPSLVAQKKTTNFTASFSSVLEKSVQTKTLKINVKSKIPLRKTEKRKSLSCPVEVSMKDSLVLNPQIFERLRGESRRVFREKIRRPEPSRGQSLAASKPFRGLREQKIQA